MPADFSQSRQTLLVIDDDNIVRDFLQIALKRLGYCVLAAPNGRTGLAIYKRYQSKIDLVLLDMNMPGMNGSELYKRLRDWDPMAKCLMISGDAPPDEIESLKRAGLAGYLPKPFTIHSLVNHLHDVMANDAPDK